MSLNVILLKPKNIGDKMDKTDIEILSAIRNECKKSPNGAYTGELLEFCNHNENKLLQRLYSLEKEKMIKIGKPLLGSGIETDRKLIAAGNITLTPPCERLLDSSKQPEP